MEIKIGKKRLKQIEGSDCDNIIFIDRDTKKEYSFDVYLELLKKENK